MAIKPIIEGRNVIALGQPCIGRKLAFTIGILQRIDTSKHETQALILVSTRELASHLYMNMEKIGERIPNLTIELFRGGDNVQDSKRRASTLPHIAVATPGRALQLINEGYLRCENLSIFCISEAEVCLEGNFLEQIQQIISNFSPTIQFLIFFSRISSAVNQMLQSLVPDPIKIVVGENQPSMEGIKQFYVDVGQPNYKMDTLMDIYGSLSISKAIIFANSRDTVNYLVDQFTRANFDVSAYSSTLSNAERESVMRDFRLRS